MATTCQRRKCWDLIECEAYSCTYKYKEEERSRFIQGDFPTILYNFTTWREQQHYDVPHAAIYWIMVNASSLAADIRCSRLRSLEANLFDYLNDETTPQVLYIISTYGISYSTELLRMANGLFASRILHSQ